MTLSEFFAKAGTKNIVINSDIDGFLSGMILQKYYGCKVVGFSNSKESIWISPDVKSIKEPVYIDIFVNDPDVYCIDQHIVAYDKAHLEKILSCGTKMNPNLNESRRTYSGDLGEIADYYKKYPFGTVHYLIALMKEDGIEVEINNLTKVQTITDGNSNEYSVCPAQIILRADDALFSSLGPYEDNTKEWWGILREHHSLMIEQLINYKDKSCDKSKNYEYKDNLAKLFVEGLNCDGKDGAFNTITNPDGRTLQPRIIKYNEIINKVMGIEMELPKELVEHRGVAHLSSYSVTNLNNAVTYAFVSSPRKAGYAFSYTTNLV